MKKNTLQYSLRTLAVITLLMGSMSIASAAPMTITAGATAPTSNVEISYNPAANNNDIVKWNGDTLTTQVRSVGQTFTTLGTGFNLSAISIRTQGGVGADASGAGFVVNLYSQSSNSGLPGAGVLLTTLTGTTPAGIIDTDYITFTLATPITLAATSNYSFDLSFTSSSATRFFGIAASSNWAGPGTFYNGDVGGFIGNPTVANTAVPAANYIHEIPLSVNFIVQSVPEPTSVALVALGAGAMFLLARRRRA